MARTGNFPCEGGTGLWHQDGRGCLSEEGRPNTSWPASIRVGEGGRRPVQLYIHGHEGLKYLRFISGCSRDPTRRIRVVRAAAERS